jgi:hypothetical protein
MQYISLKILKYIWNPSQLFQDVLITDTFQFKEFSVKFYFSIIFLSSIDESKGHKVEPNHLRIHHFLNQENIEKLWKYVKINLILNILN